MTTGLLTTTAGRNAIIADLGGGTDLVLTHVAWGDANGVPYNPNEAQVALVNEKYRATIASVAVVGGAIVVDAIIPADTNDGSGRPSHGFSVAEVGLFNNAGTLIGVARCGNGYKPPPSSGQAHDVTYRLKLAVANPSAISVVIDPLAQIALGRHIRAPWLTVDGVLNAPPANPNQGDTYIVGLAPTGAWTGFASRIAQWVGVWSLSVAPIGHHVVDNSKDINSGSRWLERTAAGWAPGVSRLAQRQAGNFAVVGGTANAITLALDPPISAYSDLPATPVRFVATGNNTGNVTLNVNGVGAIPLRYSNGRELTPGEIFTGRFVSCLVLGASPVAYLINPAQLLVGATIAITASGTFTVPAGVTLLRKVRVWGAGGGGGGANGTGAAGSGGGAGGYGEFSLAVTPGQIIACTIGTGGNAGGNVSNGLPGGTTSFGSFCSCTGGGGGTGSTGGAVGGAGVGGSATFSGVTGFAPATAGTGIGYPVGGSLYAGGTGGAAYTTPLNQPSVGGAGALGQFPGNGGNGAAAAAAGGNGANGLILVEY